MGLEMEIHHEKPFSVGQAHFIFAECVDLLIYVTWHWKIPHLQIMRVPLRKKGFRGIFACQRVNVSWNMMLVYVS